MSLIDLSNSKGKDTIVLTKIKGKYGIAYETDSLLELSRELVKLYKDMGKSNEEILKLLKLS
jgi:hypothetical protein